MKSYVPNPESLYTISNDLPLQDDEPISEDESESTENASDLELDDFFVEYDHIIYSISNWIDKFKEIMPETHIVDMQQGVASLFTDEINVLDVQNSEILNEFCAELDSAITKVGGTAFIKNNWHAPKDASMFSLNHLLKVSNSRDALSYMMYSDIFMKDFDNELGNMSFCVAVRPWMDIHPASEFRCIVVHNELVGITPREWPKYYAHYKDIMPTVIETLSAMFKNQIKDNFEAENYIFDVIYTSAENCMLWDFSPLNESTRLYAFLWEEIKNIAEETPQPRTPVFRYLAEDFGIVPSNLSYQQQC